MNLRAATLALVVFASALGMAAQDEKTEWKPGADAYPMWLHCDLTSRSGVNKAPDQKHFDQVWRINGEFGRASFAYVYGELDDRSRSNLDALDKQLAANFVQSPSDIVHRHANDFDFKNFVPGTDNGWKSIRARRVSFNTNIDNKPRHFEALILSDGKRRVWTFMVNFAADFADGQAIADRLLGSIQITNRIDVGDATNHYRAAAFPSGRIRRDVAGTVPGQG